VKDLALILGAGRKEEFSMSDVMLTIIDAHRAIHGNIHGSDADRVVAALAAEPETIEELEAAVARFIKPTDEYGVFDFFDEGICEEPWDAGIVIVDLAARLAASESTYSHLQKQGAERYHNGSYATDVWAYYQVPDDWLFIDSIDGWQALAERRRAERASTPPLDARKVIYDKVTEFIVKECLAAAAAGPATSLHSVQSLPQSIGALSTVEGTADPIADIHARWLMTPRPDLRGQSPRDVLLAKREFIDLDLQWRAHQWTFLGECPPGISPESAAYRFGGFGIHENVLYYDLVRYLLNACWHHVSDEKHIEVESEIERLERLKEDWLYTPQYDFESMSPFDVIQRERARLPVAVSAGHAGIDDDCPLCQMMRESDSPTFWHLDGAHIDFDFPFSFYLTREEWEEEMRRWEDFDRRWEERRNNPSAEDDEIELLSPVWQRSYTDWDGLETLPPEEAITLTLLGIGGHLAELGLDLRNAPEGEGLAESLQRGFADLRHALHADTGGALTMDTSDGVEACLHRLRECLAAVTVAMPGIADKCTDLHNQLDRLGSLFEVRLAF